MVKTTTPRNRTAAAGASSPPATRLASHETVGEIAALERRVRYRKLVDTSRLRGWTGKPAAGQPSQPGEPARTLVAKFADGPLSGSTREITAVEGRPPKTIDVDSKDRKVRYCLAEWEQSGHSAIYGFLYEV
jgi:hypothetical protein